MIAVVKERIAAEGMASLRSQAEHLLLGKLGTSEDQLTVDRPSLA